MNIAKTLVAFISVVALAGFIPACGSSSTSPSSTALGIEELVVGTGATVAAGDTVNVSYVGRLASGSQFDAGTFSFRVGAGSVIKGFDDGMIGMRVGGKRRLTIPPNLGYGSQGSGPVPGNATIIFDVTLNSIAGK